MGLDTSGSDVIPAFTAINTDTIPDTATINITPSANGCFGTPYAVSIVVNPTPFTRVPDSFNVCNGAPAPVLYFSSAVIGSSFAWSATPDTFGLGFAGVDSVGLFPVVNHGYTRLYATITVVATANGCVGPMASLTYVANPTPDVNHPLLQARCSGTQTDSVHFSSHVNGTEFLWTNNLPLIGIADSGNGTIPVTTVSNYTVVKDTALIIVTPVAAGCSGTPYGVKIVVYPQPTVTLPASKNTCTGTSFPILFLSGPLPGSTFLWTATHTETGISSSGVDSIRAFVGYNLGLLPDTSVVTVTAVASGCSGPSGRLQYIINPTPRVDTPSLMWQCNGVAWDTLHFLGTEPGIMYSWTNNMAGIGIPASGTGDIYGYTAINTGTVNDTAVLSVTPSAHGCTGSPVSFKRVVRPSPDATGGLNAALCSGGMAPTQTFSSRLPGTTFNWTCNNTSIGLDSNGTGSLPAFHVQNNTPYPDSAVIHIVPVAAGCSGPADSIVILVDPVPELSSRISDTVCSGSSFVYAPTSTVANVDYAWSRATTSGISEAGTNGTGSISENLYNTSATTVLATYVYTLTAGICVSTQTVGLAVMPPPSLAHIDIHPNTAVCAGAFCLNFGTATPPESGWSYYWSSPDIGEVLAQGSGNQYSLISFPTPGEATVLLSVILSGQGCSGSDTFRVSVGDSGIVTPPVRYVCPNFLCLLNNQEGYQWGFDDRTTLDSALLSGETSQNYYDPHPDFKNKYYWVMTRDGDCFQKTYINSPELSVATTNPVDFSLVVYPNPASDIVRISMTGDNRTEVVLTDLPGRRLAATTLQNGTATFDISALTPGMYMVSCYRGSVRLASDKFLKQ
jgi:hypothetical protein